MRLIACAHCDRQYDVSHHAEGSRLRCVCGESLTVVHHEPHEPRALRCPGCGAPFAPGSHHCSYCRIEIDPLQMSFSSLCPHCHARMAADASYCMDCGREIAPQILVPVAEGQACPRCEGALVSRQIGGSSLIECSGCLGIWLPVASFEDACRNAEKRANLMAGLTSPVGASERPRPEFKYLRCLCCNDFMVPRNYGGKSGIILDVCGRHGVWLDAGELQAIVRWVESGAGREEDRSTSAKPAGSTTWSGRTAERSGSSQVGLFTLEAVFNAVLDFFTR
ncbi:MAG: zf-TFIIB domain-containing protein [Planctomycetes bacterium]|nr:zf-TFIIB domain-containing protein [Planctomycetota bacterium]